MATSSVRGDGYDAATHTYYLAGRRVPGVTEVLKSAGIIDATFLRNADALRRGTNVHKLCEWLDQTRALGANVVDFAAGGLSIVDSAEILAGYARAYAALLRDHAPRYTHVEVGLLHATMRYGGRPDRICADLCGEGPAILELKTGHPAPWHGVQLAAYQFLFPTGSRWVCYLRPDGRYNLRRMTGADDYDRFREALADYQRAA